MLTATRLVSAENRLTLNDFIKIPWRIYSSNSPWIAPLYREVRFKLDAHRNPFYRHGELKAFVVYDRKGNACGRIAAITDNRYMRIHGEPVGFFGLFECINDTRIAEVLINGTAEYLRAKGYTRLLGPVNLTTNDESGFLIEGFEFRPTFMCNYCPPYYHNLMDACGLAKAIDTLSYEGWYGHAFPEKYRRVIKRVKANPRISVERLQKANAERDILRITWIYNQSLTNTWGFVPISNEEALSLGKNLMRFADLNLVWIAYFENRPVGFIMGFPDLNEIMAKLNGCLFPLGFLRILFGRKSIQGMRIAALGVLPSYRRLGIETLLIHLVHERVNTRPYRRSEFSVVMEDNLPMRNLLESFGFRICRRFRLYQKEI